MRKSWLVIMMLAIIVCFTAPVARSGWQEEVKADLNKPSEAYTAEIAKAEKFPVYGAAASTRVEVLRDGGDILFTLYNPMITPKGDTKGAELAPATTIKVGSGLRHAIGREQYFTESLPVVGGKVSFRVANLGLKEGVDTIEHLYFIGTTASGAVGYGVLNPKDQYVSYKLLPGGQPDLETLAIAVVEGKDGSVSPVKDLGRGKLAQGRYRNGAGNP